MSNVPQYTKALVLRKSQQQSTPVYHDAVIEERPIPQLKRDQVLVQIRAVSFNHRDLWIRRGQYPGIAFDSVFGADGAGTVVASGDGDDVLLHKRVFLVPMRGWESDPDAPESTFTILGGGAIVPIGTFAQYVVVERDQVILSPDHVDDEHLAAWPLGGVTAWRAAVVNANVQRGENVLITGIGGGVALVAMQICLARGANVYVSSGNDEKIRKAISLGAKGGVNYKTKDWPSQLESLLRNSNGKQAFLLSAVIDSGGGDIVSQVGRVLKNGGKIVIYGMTASPKVTFTMREVLKNQKILGSTMGSHKDLSDATDFLSAHRIVPVISHVLEGLDSAEQGFELLKSGDHFGKVVVRIGGEAKEQAKL